MEFNQGNTWSVRDPEGNPHKPLTWIQIKEYIASGKITIAFAIFHPQKTSGRWVRISNIPELNPPNNGVNPPPIQSPPISSPAPENKLDWSFLTPPNQNIDQLPKTRKSKATGILFYLDFRFERYITLQLVRLIWIIVCVLSFTFMLLTVFVIPLAITSIMHDKWTTPQQKLVELCQVPLALLVLFVWSVFQIFVARVVLEAIVVFFNSAQTLSEIRRELREHPQ